MKLKFLKSLKKLISALGAIVLIFMLSQCNEEPKYVSLADSFADVETAKSLKLDYSLYNPPKDIKSQNPDAPISELAEFAWQEFIALNWPYDPNSRSFPDKSKPNGFITSSQVGGATYTPVWQTYWHRNELFPASGKTPVVPKKNDASKPIYQYSETFEFLGERFLGTGKYDLWNNLDEVSELGQDVVYAHSTTATIDSTYQVLYEAKMNYDGSRYIYDNGLQDATTRKNKRSNTASSVQNQGVCKAESGDYIALPCGELDTGGIEGNIEIKAAWRKLNTAKDSVSRYHIQKVIYYKNVKDEDGKIKSYYQNDTFGLVGLHIIHKTKTFPTYVFATFEHVDNLDSDMVYTELENTPFGDTAKTNVEVGRTHPIPEAIKAINKNVKMHLGNNNSIWQYYKLINVQAKPMDVKELESLQKEKDKDKDKDKIHPMTSSFYLSNSVIESNKELQTFTGSLTSPDSLNVKTASQAKRINMGGCMGCHGNAQKAGTDFNFLIADAPFSIPEFTGITIPGCPTGAKTKPLNSWADVQAFLSNCAIQTRINTPGGHGKFWDKPGLTPKENYDFFTSKKPNGNSNYGKVFGYKICECGDSENSNIIKYLTGKNIPSFPGRMPKGGPYFTKAQIKMLADWIDAKCPY